MTTYFLPTYSTTCLEKIFFPIISPFAFHHLQEANQHPEAKWGHRAIAVLEFCPVVGPIFSIIEAILSSFYKAAKASFIDLTTPNKTWLVRGHQQDSKSLVNINDAKNCCRRLNTFATTNIRFNEARLEPKLEGGACQAMAMNLISQLLASINGALRYQPDTLRSKITEIGEKHIKVCHPPMCDIQAAMNTIEVVSTNSPDIKREKIQSLANLFNLKVAEASTEIDLESSQANDDLKKILNQCSDGTYLIRCLHFENNHKLEIEGHSLTYLKNNGVDILYDPNRGIAEMRPDKKVDTIYNELMRNYHTFNIPNVRFYRMQKKPVPTSLNPLNNECHSVRHRSLAQLHQN